MVGRLVDVDQPETHFESKLIESRREAVTGQVEAAVAEDLSKVLLYHFQAWVGVVEG